jgi:hypothetical protein
MTMHFETYQNVFRDWSIDPSKLPSQHNKQSLFLEHLKKCNKLKKRHNNFKIKKYWHNLEDLRIPNYFLWEFELNYMYYKACNGH